MLSRQFSVWLCGTAGITILRGRRSSGLASTCLNDGEIRCKIITLYYYVKDVTEVRFTSKNSDNLWERVWNNLHAAEAPDSMKSTWYRAIHDILPTKERMAAIGLTNTSSCVHCGQVDTLQHRVVDSGGRPVI